MYSCGGQVNDIAAICGRLPSRIAPGHVNGPGYSTLNILKDIRWNYYKNNVALLVPNYPKNGLETGNKYSRNPRPIASLEIA